MAHAPHWLLTWLKHHCRRCALGGCLPRARLVHYGCINYPNFNPESTLP